MSVISGIIQRRFFPKRLSRAGASSGSSPDWTSAKEPVGEEFPELDSPDTIYKFNVRGIRLDAPRSILEARLWRGLMLGYYEGSEIDALRYAIRAGDRILEIGAGIGFISSFATRELKASHVVAVEADPDLIPIIRHNHEINEVTAEVINAAASPRDEGTITFNRQPAFWASSVVDLPGGKKINVPARRLQSLVDEVDPDVLIVDTEGAEGRLFEDFNPPRRLRHAIVEMHKPQIGLAAISACFSAMSRASMAYDPDGSANTNVTFSRMDS